MTYDEILNIAKRLDKKTQKKIDKEVEERLVILKTGELNEQEMDKMEECLYMSLVLQEFLDGEYEILEEEKILLLDDMEDLYNQYNDLLAKAKLEKKLSRKKMMALELMKIREQLMNRKQIHKNLNERMKENRDNKSKLEDSSNKESMKQLANDVKEEKKTKKSKKGKSDLNIGLDNDMGVSRKESSKQEKITEDNTRRIRNNEVGLKNLEDKTVELTNKLKETNKESASNQAKKSQSLIFENDIPNSELVNKRFNEFRENFNNASLEIQDMEFGNSIDTALNEIDSKNNTR